MESYDSQRGGLLLVEEDAEGIHILTKRDGVPLLPESQLKEVEPAGKRRERKLAATHEQHLPDDLTEDLKRLGGHIQARRVLKLESPVKVPIPPPAAAPQTEKVEGEWEIVEGAFSDDSDEEWQEVDANNWTSRPVPCPA